MAEAANGNAIIDLKSIRFLVTDDLAEGTVRVPSSSGAASTMRCSIGPAQRG